MLYMSSEMFQLTVSVPLNVVVFLTVSSNVKCFFNLVRYQLGHSTKTCHFESLTQNLPHLAVLTSTYLQM